jgi:type I restriction enzyme R subunit
MTEGALSYLTPEAQARVRIDEMLGAAGWAVQRYGAVNLSAARGVAVREFVLAPGHGRADYLLFVDGAAVGALEAKKEGETLTGVAWQTSKYVDGIPADVPAALEGALPFVYQSTGRETRFTNSAIVCPCARGGRPPQPLLDFARPSPRSCTGLLRNARLLLGVSQQLSSALGRPRLEERASRVAAQDFRPEWDGTGSFHVPCDHRTRVADATGYAEDSGRR